jgi:hypothetical protein
MRYFCTYFDSNYLLQGLALYRSLKQHSWPFTLWILCMDDPVFEVLTRLELKQTYLIPLRDLEKDDDQLRAAKQTRDVIEYYFTCTPCLPLYILRNNTDVDIITYLDADLFFFSDPVSLYEEMANHSIAITEHRFAPAIRHLACYGTYNVGWLSFRRDKMGLACLEWWRDRCIEWCHARYDGTRFADQKYLDEWPNLFERLIVLRHKGANLAPWNLGTSVIHRKGGSVWADGERLIFFHFHGLKKVKEWLYYPDLARYRVAASSIVRRHIYKPYIQSMVMIKAELGRLLGELPAVSTSHPGGRHTEAGSAVTSRNASLIRVFGRLILGRYIIFVGDRVV